MTINEGQSDPLLIKINLTASDAELKRDFLKIIELQRSRHVVAKLPPNKGTKYRKPQWGYIRYVDMESLSGNQSHASMRSRAKADAEEYGPLLREMVHLVVVPYLMEVREKGTWKGVPIYFAGRPGLGWADDNVSSDRGPFEAYLMKQFSQKPRRSKRHSGKRPGLSLADLVIS